MSLNFSKAKPVASTSSPNKYQELAEYYLGLAGIKINGPNPYDPQVSNPKVYRRVFRDGSLGLGESYMEGWWDCDRLDEMVARLITAKLDKKIPKNPKVLFYFLKAKLFNESRPQVAFEIGEKHYDLGNDLFKAMLDENLVYSCGYWQGAKTLAEAQENKLDLICKKLGLQPGMRFLDIGCGWGSLLQFAAKRYKIQGVGITVSKEQRELAMERCSGLPVEIHLQDYRDLNEKFDRIASVGMFEHVGYKNYPVFIKTVERCLEKDGLFLLHTIGNNITRTRGDLWIKKYIFPQGMLPSLKQIFRAAEGWFVLEDLHNFGTDYDKTLMEWNKNFEENWDAIKEHYGQRFFRLWRYYLLSCAGLFRGRKCQLWQFVFSKRGIPGGYPINSGYG